MQIYCFDEGFQSIDLPNNFDGLFYVTFGIELGVKNMLNNTFAINNIGDSARDEAE